MSLYFEWALIILSLGVSVILIVGLTKIHRVSLKTLREAEKMRADLRKGINPLDSVTNVIQEIQIDVQTIKDIVGKYPAQKGDQNNANN